MKNIVILFLVLMFILSGKLLAAQCDPTVPTFNLDFTGQPFANWVSPPTQRDGSCCGQSPNCVAFVITLDPGSLGVSFTITGGAIPPGSLTYFVNCQEETVVGDTVCLIGTGPHLLTFCKPGNNVNEYTIQTLTFGPISHN